MADEAQDSTPTAEVQHRPRFDFYDLLPESRVPVGADRPEVQQTPLSPSQAPVTEPSRESPPPAPETPQRPSIVTIPTPAGTTGTASTRPDSIPPEVPAPSPPPSTTPGGAETQKESFMLQAGSFRNVGDADNLRAQLLLMGMSARIETFNASEGETWHRVIVGPYGSHGTMDTARAQLAANGIDTLMLRR